MKMNVRFEDGKTIIDGIPELLYINEECYGVGQLFLGEKQETGLRSIDIHASTITDEYCPPLTFTTERVVLK
jgi:hypothetical protein